MVVGSGGTNGWVYALRNRSWRIESSGDGPPGGPTEAPAITRRRVLAAWVLCLTWLVGLTSPVAALFTFIVTFGGAVYGVGIAFDPATEGSPLRRWGPRAAGAALLGWAVLILVWV